MLYSHMSQKAVNEQEIVSVKKQEKLEIKLLTKQKNCDILTKLSRKRTAKWRKDVGFEP